ncbi:MAG: coproporphyrinogen dehydrogenase HemZ [Lachnospiraceae bacterium]|nr:coproporphyrinogen dehydrogenase HemZ [Lachnospiraceae bacterium]
MIKIHLKDDAYESDVRAMVQAFYPNVLLFVEKDETVLEKQRIKTDEPIEFTLDVDTEVNDKNELKRRLYSDLSIRTGKTLPWGTLTGIRPTKIPMKLLHEGYSDPDIMEELKREYLVSHDKAQLSLNVAKEESGILSKVPSGSYSLYIHIPFCPTRCAYCSFTSFPADKYEDMMHDYVDVVITELKAIAVKKRGKKPSTIYMGGGTPTALPCTELTRLCNCIKELFYNESLLEWTVEAGRPDSIDEEKLRTLLNAGVTRISINPQTMNQATLDIIGRHHSVEDIYKTFKLARQVGFNNINADLIMGLPNEGVREVEHTLQCIKALEPESLTVHSLARKHNADMTVNADMYIDYMLSDTEKLMDMARHTADELNLKPYYLYRQKMMSGNQENIGYALPGKEGYYNILIMEEYHSIISAGAGAITKIVDTPGHLKKRIENVKDVREYIKRIDEMIERKVEI